MQVVECTSTQLTIRSYPWFSWLVAVVMLISAHQGGFLDSLYNTISLIANDQFIWKAGIGGSGEMVLGVVLIVAATLFGILSTIDTITFDVTLRELIIEESNVLKNWKSNYSFSSISVFEFDHDYEDGKYDLLVAFTNEEKKRVFSNLKWSSVERMTDFFNQHAVLKEKYSK